tara:strand:+ start:150 stop:464 length:315 start_codon:yes stop_codon:yes gene_type:complete
MKKYELIFDEIILGQLKSASKNNQTKRILTRMLDRIEEQGPRAGKILDSQLRIYEMKTKKPPIRLYFKHNATTNEIYIFEYEMKKSEKKQKLTINKLRRKVLKS